MTSVIQERDNISVVKLWSAETKSHRRVHRITCSEPGCTTVETIPDNGSVPMPEQVMAKKFKDRGWMIGNRANSAVCPTHASMKKSKLVAEFKKPDPIPEAPAASEPRTPTRDDRRRIRDALDVHYQVERGRYAGAWSDKKLGETLKLPWAWIAEERELGYGPDASEITSINQAKIDALRARIEKINEECMGFLLNLDKKIGELKEAVERVAREVGDDA